jgi:hypothetical protein
MSQSDTFIKSATQTVHQLLEQTTSRLQILEVFVFGFTGRDSINDPINLGIVIDAIAFRRLEAQQGHSSIAFGGPGLIAASQILDLHPVILQNLMPTTGSQLWILAPNWDDPTHPQLRQLSPHHAQTYAAMIGDSVSLYRSSRS